MISSNDDIVDSIVKFDELMLLHGKSPTECYHAMPTLMVNENLRTVTWDEAVEDYSKALSLLRMHGAALSAKSNDASQAFDQLQSELRVLNNRAYCLAKLERFSEAIDDYSHVIDIEPTNSHALHNRGLSLDKLGRHEEAMADFKKVLDLEDVSANVEVQPIIWLFRLLAKCTLLLLVTFNSIFLPFLVARIIRS